VRTGFVRVERTRTNFWQNHFELNELNSGWKKFELNELNSTLFESEQKWLEQLFHPKFELPSEWK